MVASKQPVHGSSLLTGSRIITNHCQPAKRSRSIRRFLFLFGLLYILGQSLAYSQTYHYPTSGSQIPNVIPWNHIYILDGNTTAIYNYPSGNISIEPYGRLILRNGAVLRMRDTIHVQNCNVSSLHLGIGEVIEEPEPLKSSYYCHGGELQILSGSRITSYNTANSGRWGGVYVWGAMQNPYFYEYSENRGSVYMNNGTIEKAFIGINTAKSRADVGNAIHPGGIVRANNSNFLNCERMVNMRGFPYLYLPQPPGSLMALWENGNEHFVKCEFKYTNTYVPYSGGNHVAKAYADLPCMFTMYNGQGVNILACKFENAYYFGNTYAQRKCTGLRTNNSRFAVSNTFAQSVIGGPWYAAAPSEFKNFFSGIEVHGAPFQGARIQNTLVDNTSYCIAVGNAQYPIVTGNTMNLTNVNCSAEGPGNYAFYESRAYGIVLAYSTGYIVDNNTVNSANGVCDMGIGAYASGISLNHISYNAVNKTKAGVHGRLNNVNASVREIGLRFICNTMTNMPKGNDIYGTQAFSVAAQQSNGTMAADNTFHNPKDAEGYHIFVEPVGYNVGYHHTYLPNRNPSKNTPNVGEIYNSTNACNSRRMPQSPLRSVMALADMEGDIMPLLAIPQEERTPTETEELTELMYEHNMLVDSFILYYLYGDTSVMHQDSIVPHTDSIAWLLGQVNVNYMYKILLAEALHTLGDTDSAIAVIDAIPGSFTLDTDEAGRVANIKTMYQIYQMLAVEGNTLDSLDVGEYAALLSIRDNDDFYAAGMARNVWFVAHPQDIDSMRIGFPLPEEEIEGDSYKGRESYAHSIVVYPSPAGETISFDYPYSGSATYTISDIQGRVLLNGKVSAGNNEISVATLSAGIYILSISEGGRTIHRAKIAKQ